MKVARLYAQVLIDSAYAEKHQVDLTRVAGELESLSQALAGSSLGRKVFSSPILSDEQKLKSLDALCERLGVSEFSVRFLRLILKKGRVDSLPDILQEVDRLQVERRGGVVAEVVSAIPLDSQALSNLTDALTKKFKKPVQLKPTVDPVLIAGMKITINGVTYDGTVRSKLEKFASL